MKTVTQYKEDIKTLMDKLAAMDATATQENRDLTDAELNVKNEIMETVEDYRKIVLTMERQQRIADTLDNPEDPKTIQKSGDLTTPQHKKDVFGTFGEQISAVIRAGSPGGTVDPRLIKAAATGLGETVPSDGGFLVQQDFTTRLMEDLFENSLILGQCEQIPISGPSNGIVINGYDETSRASNTYGGIVIYHADEAEEKTASKPKFRRVELALKKMIGLCYLTDELQMDVPALEGAVSNAFRKAFDFQTQDDLINGTGAGMALGIMNAGCLVSVTKEAGQAADTIVTENIVNMYKRRFASQTGNYRWYYNQDIESQLFTMSLSVGTGGIPVYMPPGGLSAKPYATIMGLPAYAIEQCATLGDKGDIILANFKDGYVTAQKGGLQQAFSIHVRFVYDEGVLRFVLRFDGQPWRALPLTPYKGSNTQSHFIVLNERA